MLRSEACLCLFIYFHTPPRSSDISLSVLRHENFELVHTLKSGKPGISSLKVWDERPQGYLR
jgi:hypothetical protein